MEVKRWRWRLDGGGVRGSVAMLHALASGRGYDGARFDEEEGPTVRLGMARSLQGKAEAGGGGLEGEGKGRPAGAL
jgi:hypothetical protein